MADKMDMDDWRLAAFGKVLRGLPPPIPMYDNAIICPWCGADHKTITIGYNNCIECRRCFIFGYPPFETTTKRPVSWVDISWEEQEYAIDHPNVMPEFKPNARLLEIYEFWAQHDRGQKDSPSPVLH